MLPNSSHILGGDSSESHDTDHLVDDEPLDDMDSPPAVSCILIFTCLYIVFGNKKPFMVTYTLF